MQINENKYLYFSGVNNFTIILVYNFHPKISSFEKQLKIFLLAALLDLEILMKFTKRKPFYSSEN